MNVLYITQTFPPEPGATARPLYNSLYLKKLGYEITVLTTMPNYPMGKIFKGYRWKLFKKENYNGVDVLRIWSLPFKNSGKVKRILGYLSFVFSASICGLVLKKYDILIASVPHLGTELVGLIVGKIKKSIIILELRDIIPDNLEFIGIPKHSFVSNLLNKYYSYVDDKMDIIVVPGTSMKKTLIFKGIDKNKIIVLPHGADSKPYNSNIGKKLKTHYNLNNNFIVMYSGSFSPYYDILNYIHAASILSNQNKSIRFVLIGQGTDYEKASQLIHRQRLNNVILTGSVNHKEIEDFHSIADVFITSYVSFKTTPEYMQDYIYTKVAEYLMAGKPLIAIEDGRILGNIIKNNNLGTVVEPKRPDLLAAIIINYANNINLVTHQGFAARAYALENLNREKNIERFDIEFKAKCHFKQ
ncbi:MAG: glycosyltransferase, family 1 [Ignavibacteria bacterium]|nr:glycosyltransferase, family 1 [Ignavibacteria bacterium]